jgi:dihydroorotate dehydrogenase
VTRLKNLLYGTAITLALTLGYFYITDTRARIHQWVVIPFRWIYDDAENAHKAGNKTLKSLYDFGLHPRERRSNGDLSVKVFGHQLQNPIGTSAGIDKGAEIPGPLFALGPAIVEVGGTTPFPQDGNSKPRVFRLPSQNGLINRYGLNSEGADVVAMRLRQRVRMYAHKMGIGLDEEAQRKVLDGQAGVPPGSLIDGKLLAVQIAKNKSTPGQDLAAVERDYVYCVDQLGRYADIIVVNVSSPNTPGLRSLQRVEPLTRILTGVVNAAKNTDRKSKPAVMVKVSPDEDSDEQINGICDAIWQSGVDGVIVGNTTNTRPAASGHDLPSKEAALLKEKGGYSGPHLFEKTVSLVKRYRHVLDGGPSSTRGRETAPNGDIAASSPPNQEPRTDEKLVKDSLQGSLIPEGDSGKSQPLIRLPDRHSILGPKSGDESLDLKGRDKENDSRPESLKVDSLQGSLIPEGSSTKSEPLLQTPDRHRLFGSSDKDSDPGDTINSTTPSKSQPPVSPKVIFATGGITNGKQALEIINAGASVAMVYTALVYGGVGTISRIKEEMRRELASKEDKQL